MTEALEQSLAETQQSFEREKRFRADAAHELMTPVSAIQSEAEITLRRERAPAAYQESLRAIQERAAHMSALVERLLTLSRLEASGPAEAQPANLSALSRAVIRRHQRPAESRGLVLTTDIEDGVWVRAAGSDFAGRGLRGWTGADRSVPHPGGDAGQAWLESVLTARCFARSWRSAN